MWRAAFECPVRMLRRGLLRVKRWKLMFVIWALIFQNITKISSPELVHNKVDF